MGGDGGSIIGRDCLVKVRKTRENAVDPGIALEQRSAQCRITTRQLTRPVVADELGNLYNKQAILEHLLSKVDVPSLRHIRGLKDIMECKLMFQGEKSKTDQSFSSAVSTSTELTHIVCPVTASIFNGRIPFIIMRECGCVISLPCYEELVNERKAKLYFKSIKEIPLKTQHGETPECPSCGAALLEKYFDAVAEVGETPYIRLNPPEDVADVLRRVMFSKREKALALKKDKKNKKENKKGKKDGENDTELTAFEQESNEALDRPAKRRKNDITSSLLRMTTEENPSRLSVVSLDTVSEIVRQADEALKQKKAASATFGSMWN